MPKLDRTGPLGAGPGTGYGLGPCFAGPRYGYGRGYRRVWTRRDEISFLEEERKNLEEELKAIKEDLKVLRDQK